METVGQNCHRFLQSKLIDIPVENVQLDELWAFVGVRGKNKREDHGETVGDFYTFLAIERGSKLVLAYRTGRRDGDTACDFLMDLKKATTGIFMVSADGFRAHENGIPYILGTDVEFGQLIKEYAHDRSHNYAPSNIHRAQKVQRTPGAEYDQICTSHIERFNGTYPDQMARFSRLSKAHSKSIHQHCNMQSIFLAFYNFVRPHSSLGRGITPAVASGLTSDPWTIQRMLSETAL